MPKYRVTLCVYDYFDHMIEADSQKEAEKSAMDGSSDSYEETLDWSSQYVVDSEEIKE